MSHRKIDVKKLSDPLKKKNGITRVGKVGKPDKIKAVATPRRRKV
jgi:hypothetical protein